MSEWLRRQTRNLLGYACAGSNPAVDASLFTFVFSLKFTICNLYYYHGFAFPNFYSLKFTICNLYYYHGFAFPNFFSLKFTICNLYYYHGFVFRKGYFIYFCER
jgi:hypothetical protein